MNAKVRKPNKKWEDMKPNEKRRGVIIIVVLILIIIGIPVAVLAYNKPAVTHSEAVTTTKSKPQMTPTAPKLPTRQVTGSPTTLGAGSFTGGKDVAVGLYDVTPGSGESGNFYVTGKDSYNEILGNIYGAGVSRIRVKISDGDAISISGLSEVVFTPVTTPYDTAYATTILYAGMFIVGQDIGAGRYIATPDTNESGNFYVTGTDSYNEILGGRDGVPSVTVNLTKGDVINLSGLEQVTFTPSS